MPRIKSYCHLENIEYQVLILLEKERRIKNKILYRKLAAECNHLYFDSSLEGRIKGLEEKVEKIREFIKKHF